MCDLLYEKLSQEDYNQDSRVEILEDFIIQAKNKNIFVHLKSERGIVDNPSSFVEFFKLKKESN